MKRSKRLNLIGMCVSLALIVCELVGIYLLAVKPIAELPFTVDSLKYYTVLTSLITLLGAMLMIWSNIVSVIKKKDCTPRLFYSIRFLSAVMSLLTFITVAVFLRPAFTNFDALFDLQGGCIFLHFVCPILSMLQFVCLEIEPKSRFSKTLEPFIATLIYAVTILIIVLVKAGKDPDEAATWAPYFFFWITPELAEAGSIYIETNFAINIGVALGIIVISYVASLIVWGVNRIVHAIVVGVDYHAPAPKAKKEKVPSKAVASKKKGTKQVAAATPVKKKENSFTKYVKAKVAFGDKEAPTGGQIYHVSFHDRRLKTWKVKTENATRALKVFPTQKEAIAFATEQIKKNGGSIRVHSVMGGFRKD